MIRRIVSLLIVAGMATSLVACGVKSPPKYVPDTSKTEQKNS